MPYYDTPISFNRFFTYLGSVSITPMICIVILTIFGTIKSGIFRSVTRGLFANLRLLRFKLRGFLKKNSEIFHEDFVMEGRNEISDFVNRVLIGFEQKREARAEFQAKRGDYLTLNLVHPKELLSNIEESVD